MAEKKAAKSAEPKQVNTAKAATLDRLKSVVEYHRTHGNEVELSEAQRKLDAALSED